MALWHTLVLYLIGTTGTLIQSVKHIDYVLGFGLLLSTV